MRWAIAAKKTVKQHLVGVVAATSIAVVTPFTAPALATLVDSREQPAPTAQATNSIVDLFDMSDREYGAPWIDPHWEIIEAEDTDDTGNIVVDVDVEQDDAGTTSTGDDSLTERTGSEQPADELELGLSSEDGDGVPGSGAPSPDQTDGVVDEDTTQPVPTSESSPPVEPEPTSQPPSQPPADPSPETDPPTHNEPDPTADCPQRDGLVTTILGLVCQLLA